MDENKDSGENAESRSLPTTPSAGEGSIRTPSPLSRDEKGRFLPKRPLEFTWPHFWLEVTEIAVGILIAQILWDVSIWLIK